MAHPQKAMLRWMLQREKATDFLAHPTWRRLVTQSGLPLWLSAATGDAPAIEPPMVRDTRGGLVCYELVRKPPLLRAALSRCLNLVETLTSFAPEQISLRILRRRCVLANFQC